MPNVFYRSGRPPVIEYPMKPGDEKTIERFNELTSALAPDAMDRDAIAYLDFFAAQDRMRPGRTAVVGYCYTGAMAVRAAAARPSMVAAAASFHGGHLYTDAATSPHLLLPRVKARLFIGHAVNDRTMPAEAIDKLNRALASWGGQYESEVFEGASHGWTVADHPAYNKPQAEKAFTKLSALLSGTLNPEP
jgi:carboxymethylenebutenolidase